MMIPSLKLRGYLSIIKAAPNTAVKYGNREAFTVSEIEKKYPKRIPNEN